MVQTVITQKYNPALVQFHLMSHQWDINALDTDIAVVSDDSFTENGQQYV